MRALEFVEKYGWDISASVVRNQPSINGTHYRLKDDKYSSAFSPSLNIVYVEDLKKLVDQWELVQSLGGIDGARSCFEFDGGPFKAVSITIEGREIQINVLKEAIETVKRIDLTHLENDIPF